MTALPIPIVVTRHQCPHCRITRAKKATTAEHMARCWRNPAVRACKTCRHYDPGGSAYPEHDYPPDPPACTAGVHLPDGNRPVEHCPLWQSALESDPQTHPATGTETTP